jgi:hypothetical protein
MLVEFSPVLRWSASCVRKPATRAVSDSEAWGRLGSSCEVYKNEKRAERGIFLPALSSSPNKSDLGRRQGLTEEA